MKGKLLFEIFNEYFTLGFIQGCLIWRLINWTEVDFIPELLALIASVWLGVLLFSDIKGEKK